MVRWLPTKSVPRSFHLKSCTHLLLSKSFTSKDASPDNNLFHEIGLPALLFQPPHARTCVGTFEFLHWCTGACSNVNCLKNKFDTCETAKTDYMLSCSISCETFLGTMTKEDATWCQNVTGHVASKFYPQTLSIVAFPIKSPHIFATLPTVHSSMISSKFLAGLVNKISRSSERL